MNKIKTPPDLKAAGRKFWNLANAETIFESSHDLARLTMACKCLDDIQAAEQQIKADGVFIKDRYGQPKEHVAAKVIRDNRIIFCRIVRELGLDIDPVPESRLPRRY
jgi:phage terminase small subunit